MRNPFKKPEDNALKIARLERANKHLRREKAMRPWRAAHLAACNRKCAEQKANEPKRLAELEAENARLKAELA